MLRKARFLIAGIVALGVATAWFFFRRTSTRANVSSALQASMQRGRVRLVVGNRLRVEEARLERIGAATMETANATKPPTDLAPSLFGTTPDGTLEVDAHGNLVVGLELRLFFDYFLTATGETEPDAIRHHVLEVIAATLTGQARQQAMELWERYLQYRRMARKRYFETAQTWDDPLQELDALSNLRRKILGPKNSEAMFGEEEQIQRVDIRRWQTLTNSELDDATRKQQLAAIDAELPEQEREWRKASTLITRLHEAQKPTSDGAELDPEELRARRTEIVGAAAAERLERLDEQRADWRRRLADFRAARSALETQDLAPNERAEILDELLAEHFTAQEQLRVRVEENLH